jgi:trigger factor
MVRDFDTRLRQQGMNMDMFLSFSGQTREDLQEQMKGDAEKRVRNNLVLEVIAKEEKIEVSEEEVTQELATMAEAYKRTPEEIRSILAANGSLSSMNDEISLRKTIDFLVSNSVEVEAVEAPAEAATEEVSAE